MGHAITRFSDLIFPDLTVNSSQVSDSVIKGITSDSREVKRGYLYVAIQGHTRDGHAYCEDAVRAGAVALVVERPSFSKLPQMVVRSSRRFLSLAAARFAGDPSHKLRMIGITGTSGKTTTSYLLESILEAAGVSVGVIGTNGVRFNHQNRANDLTTPDPVRLQHLLQEMLHEKVQTVVMEVSSHALTQFRIDGVAFDALLFTNLSHDHLDYHSNMEDYFRSKERFFTEIGRDSAASGKKPIAVVNKNDPYGARLVGKGALTFEPSADLVVDSKGIHGKYLGYKVESRLLGAFNALNISAAIMTADALGLSKKAIETGVRTLEQVPGRMEAIHAGQNFSVVVDYAHKPDALEKVLLSLKKLISDKNHLIVVMGCGGDRDRGKRPVMGEIASRLADYVIVTSDNPRTEDPQAIIREIQSGLKGGLWEVQVDRAKAISTALARAKKGDLVLIAGKGHEDYQIIGTQKHPFDDRKVALQAIKDLE